MAHCLVRTMNTIFALLLLLSASFQAIIADPGCYNTQSNTCSCTTDVCTEQKCTTAGGVWTQSCSSCSCAGGGSDPGAGEPKTGFGCYDIKSHKCNCEPAKCNKAACEIIPGRFYFVDGCKSCQCETSKAPSTAPVKAPVSDSGGNCRSTSSLLWASAAARDCKNRLSEPETRQGVQQSDESKTGFFLLPGQDILSVDDVERAVAAGVLQYP